jgi:transcriptional antiterminator NusG
MYLDNARDAYRWYAIHTHHKQENRVESNLRAWRVETFAPKLKERRVNKYNGALVYTAKALFPGYLFAHFKASELLHKIYFTRGVHSIVSSGSNPAPVDDEIIALLQSQVGDDGFVRLGEEFKPGDKVKIKSGAFENLMGIFEHDLKDSDRVVILLTAISYQGRIVLEKELLAKVS